MSKTIDDVKTYLQLLNIPNAKINKLIDRDDLAIYSSLRDRLTSSELLELQIVLRSISNGSEKQVDKIFNKYVDLQKDERKMVKDILGLKGTSNLEIASILQMEPSDLAINMIKTLL
jgi:DNA-directed RNA polymerase subunit F